MKKNKSITLLSIVGAIMAILFFFTFVRFEIGVKNYNSVIGAIDTDYDLSGGTAFTLELAKDNEEEVEDINAVTKTLSTRLEKLGYDVYKIVAYKDAEQTVRDYNIRIEAKAPLNEYGNPDSNALLNDIQVVTAYGKLEFYGGDTSNPTEEIFTDVEKVIEKAEYAGSYVNGSDTVYQVSIKFTDEAYKILEEKMNEGSFYLQVNLGEETLLGGSEALTSSIFNDRTIAVSTSTEAQAKQFALQISSGALDYKYEITETEKISSPYGENIYTIAIITLFAIVAVFSLYVAIKHRGFAIVSGLSLLLFLVLQLWMLVLIPNVRLSIGGLVGIALSLVMSILGFAVMFNNVSEEYAKGKTIKFATTTGYSRIIKPVVAMSIITAISSLAIYLLGFGVLKNFAVCFGAGAVLSAISILLFGKMFIALLLPLTKNNSAFYNLKKVDENVKEEE